MARYFVFVVALFFLVLVELGQSLKCYYCVEESTNACKRESWEIKECPNSTDYACLFRNISFSSGGGQISMDCALKSECISGRALHHNDTCNICAEDLCNASSSIFPSLLVVTGAGIIITAIISNINF